MRMSIVLELFFGMGIETKNSLLWKPNQSAVLLFLSYFHSYSM